MGDIAIPNTGLELEWERQKQNKSYLEEVEKYKKEALMEGLQVINLHSSNNQLHDLWNFQCRILKGSLIIPTMSLISPIPRIDTFI